MQVEAVIFDLDGTLVDSLQDLAGSVNHVLAELGLFPHPVGSYRQRIGQGARLMVSRALPADQQERLDQAVESFKRYYQDHCLDQTRAYPGIDHLLQQLHQGGIRLAVFSNKPQAMTTAIVEGLFPAGLFCACLGQQEGCPRKPDPTGALRITAELNCRPAATLFLGDSATDMKTAVAAGMMPVGVTWGFRSRDELIENGAQWILDTPGELLDRIPL